MTGSTTGTAPSVPGGQRGAVLIVAEDAELLDDLLRLCVAAGATPEVCASPSEHRGAWDAAPLVLVGDDAARRMRGAGRRRGVVLVGRDPDDAGVWQRAVEIGADHVLVLPDGERWLIDRIADVCEGVGRPARTVGVIGARGGAGASTLACALAVTSARANRRTVLVDADPLGGGLDVLLGGEATEGLRWPAFSASRGRVSGGALEASLPRLHGLRLLSWDRGDCLSVPAQAVRAVLAAARRGGGVVVVDLPRRVDDPVTEILGQLDLALLVVPGELRAVAAGSRMASVLGPALRDLRVVSRGPYATGMDAGEVSRLLALPLAGEAPAEAGLPRAAEDGRPPAEAGRGALARFCRDFWDRASAEPAPV
ncbi:MULTISPECIES: septum site-determining protein Ssd [unclassified Streptomyces]|uniref:septum site-determining protein Ssd n=1 Tax=unclassified Streptomyces TaxID=2593676 RepID=UPI001908F988|nr:septum site-determining protein Ssd [Streptomyces sp. HSG2]